MAKKSKQKQVKKIYPPADILRAFKEIYPEVELSEVEWSWEVPYKIWEADFEHEGKEYEVEITVTGHWLLTEVEVPKKDVPASVLKTLKALYEGAEIGDVEKVLYSNGDVHYEFDMKKGEKEFEVQLREDGLFIAEGKDL